MSNPVAQGQTAELWVEGQRIGRIHEVLGKRQHLYWSIDLVEPYAESAKLVHEWCQHKDCRSIQVKTDDTTKDLNAFLISAHWDFFRPLVEIELWLRLR
jgi:hypothetical protein